MSRSRKENIARKCKAAKAKRKRDNTRARAQKSLAQLALEQRTSGMPNDVFLMAKLMGLR